MQRRTMSHTKTNESPDLKKAKYAHRTTSGDKIKEFNSPNFSFKRFRKTAESFEIAVSTKLGVDLEYIRKSVEPLREYLRAEEDSLLSLQDEMKKMHNISNIKAEDEPTPNEIVVAGRMQCNNTEDRMNIANAVLRSSDRDSAGKKMKLIFDTKGKSFSIFPGQIVLARGIYEEGKGMKVRDLYTGVEPQPPSSDKKSILEDLKESPLSIAVAAGPFTTEDNLDYAPLNDLLEVVKENEPDILILMGPFVDERQPIVASGITLLAVDENCSEVVDMENLFRLRIIEKLKKLMAESSSRTKFVLVPNTNDFCHTSTYPQPPLKDTVPGGCLYGVEGEFKDEIFLGLGLSENDDRIYCLPNPSAFKAKGVTIALTSQDIVSDLSSEEVSGGGTKRRARMARILEHFFLQKNLYPLRPPKPGMPLEHSWASKLNFCDPFTDNIPDILIVPSQLTQFVHEVSGCLCINPGYLTRGTGGGSYAVMEIKPLQNKQLDVADLNNRIPHDVPERTSVEILKI